MAKKPNRARAAAQPAADAVKFDDTAYADVRFSATFDYDELAVSRASTMIMERGRQISLGVAFVSLAILVGMLWINRDLLLPSMVFLVIAILASNATNNWPKIQRKYANKSTLALTGGAEKRHVVVCGDAVHVSVAAASGTSADGEKTVRTQSYPLSELRRVTRGVECTLADFGQKRLVYVPRAALSDTRYKELGAFLAERAGK